MLNVQIFYLNPDGNVEMEVWECATNTEALFLIGDVCRNGLLIEGEDIVSIPAHRVVKASFRRGEVDTPPPKRKMDEFGVLLSKWRTVAGEPCPAGKKCTLLPRLVDDLEKLIGK